MKLAYITNVSMPAGDAQSIQVQAMAKAFARRLGENFLLISPRNRENKNITADYAWKKIAVPQFLPRAARYLLLAFFSTFFAFKFKPDCVYTRDIGVVAWYRMLGFKAVYEIHKPFETKIGDWFFRRFAGKVKIIAISDALRKYICEKYGIKPEQVLVAHDGVFMEDFPEIISREKAALKQKLFNAGHDEFVAVYAGSVQRGKGVELIEKIARRFAAADGGVKFFVIGEKPHGSHVDEQSALSYLGRKPHHEIANFLRAADILLYTTTADLAYYKYTSPLKLFEYMASGVPLAASNLGSVKEVVNDSMAYMFNPVDEDEFVQLISRAKSDPAEAMLKAENARREVEKYTWQKRVEKILAFLS